MAAAPSHPHVDFSIRTATVADADAIARVHEASRNAAYRQHVPADILNVMSMDERVSRWQEWLGAPDATTLTALREGRIVGFGTLAPPTDDDLDPEGVGEILTLYIHPDHWGQGIGRKLCRTLIARARERGYATLILWTMETNEAARGLYESLGFRADGARKKDPGAPASPILAIRFRLALVGGTEGT